MRPGEVVFTPSRSRVRIELEPQQVRMRPTPADFVPTLPEATTICIIELTFADGELVLATTDAMSALAAMH
jgi:hypothetical protein